MKDKFIIFGGLIIYLVIGVYSVMHHEPWRDELHSTMIAHSSNSVGELLKNKDFEGHPALWYFVLYGLKHFTLDWRATLWLNFAFAALSVTLVLFNAPFKTHQKVLIVLGYFFVYEYGTIARNYAIELVFLFAICATFSLRFNLKGQVLIGLLLAILMQTNLYGLIMGCLLSCFLLWEIVIPMLKQKEFAKLAPILLLAGTPIIIGIVLSVLSITPPVNTGINKDHTSLMSLFRSLSTVWSAYVPIPTFNLHFWNENFFYLDSVFNGHFRTPFSILLLWVVTKLLRPNKIVLTLFWTGTIIFLYFTLAKYPGFLRHHGHLYIWMLVCFWLKPIIEKTHFYDNSKPVKLPIVVRKYFFNGILIAQCMATIVAVYLDGKYPFSRGEDVAKYLEKHGHEYQTIIGHEDFSSETYAAYLNKKIYHVFIQDSAFYLVFTQKRNVYFEPSYIIDKVQNLFPETEKVLLIYNSSLEDSTHLPIHLVEKFEGAIVEDEQYYLYRVDRKSKSN